MDSAYPVNYFAILKEIFPYTLDQVIENVILIVETEAASQSLEEKLETMVNMLFGNPQADDQVEDVELQGAVGFGQPVNDTQLNQHYNNLMSVFPDACPDFMRRFCTERRHNFDFGRVCDILTKDGYEKAEADPLTIWEQLKDALPNADPSYLRREAERMAKEKNCNEILVEFLSSLIDSNDYPTKKDYMIKRKAEATLNMYKDEYFDVNQYLQEFPNPEETFRNSERKPPLTSENGNEEDERYALTFLYNHYGNIRKQHIDLVYRWKNKNLIEICDKLDKLKKGMRKWRELEPQGDTKNLELLQEIAYLKHRRLIRRLKKFHDDNYKQLKEEARKFDLLVSCQCCFDDELIPEECYLCTKGCTFCQECVVKGTEEVIGRAETKFPCFNACEGHFSLPTLQMVLPEKMFSRLFQKIQSEELKQAELEGLETCPFCDFAKIVSHEDKIFQCDNPDCMAESCRGCRHESHIPLRCNEIEYDEDVRRRTYIEKKMTEALLRTCNSCKRTFVKESGCNKMTCNCGAKMCYVCGVTISDYSHFGADRCPVFANDTALNLERVRQGAARAKQDLGNVVIKFDPTPNLEKFFS